MAIVNKDTLKQAFLTGEKPTQDDFGNLIDSYAFTGSMSQYGTTIQSDYNDDLVLKGVTTSVPINWISVIGQIPNLTSDLAGSGVVSDGQFIYTIGADTDADQAAIIKTDFDGNIVWVKEIEEDSFGECIIFKNNYLWLFYTDFDNSSNISIIQMDANGTNIGNWDFSTNNFTGTGYEIDVDELNNVYFVGLQQVTEPDSSTPIQILIGKLNTSTNNIDWSYTMGDSMGEQGISIKYFNSVIYTCGQTNGDLMIINKMDTDGNLIWSKIGNTDSQAWSLTIDTNTGNLHIVGADGDAHALTLSIDPDGNLLYCNQVTIPNPRP